MQKTVWEIGYSILFSFNKKDDIWDTEVKNVLAESAEQAIDKAKAAALKRSGFIEGENGPTKKKWHVFGFRLYSVKEITDIDIT